MARDVTSLPLITITCVILFQVSTSSSTTSDRWSQWSQWSKCSVQCGSGLQERSRGCLRYGTCRSGNEIQSRLCLTEECPPDQPTFRQKACSKYDKRVFSGKQYTWEPFVHPTDPCKLSCRAKGVHFYANLAARVRNGERCHKDGQARAVCYRGVCKPVGCDDVILSGARLDKCGVCEGDGEGCRTVAGIFSSNKTPRGINHVISIPAGSTSINMTELSPSENLLMIQSVSGKVFINTGPGNPVSGTIKAGGTSFHYSGRTSVNPRQTILSNGPTNSTVYVKLLARGSNPGISYTFSVPVGVIGSDTAEFTAGIIQPPIVKSGPEFVDDKTSSNGISALGGIDEVIEDNGDEGEQIEEDENEEESEYNYNEEDEDNSSEDDGDDSSQEDEDNSSEEDEDDSSEDDEDDSSEEDEDDGSEEDEDDSKKSKTEDEGYSYSVELGDFDEDLNVESSGDVESIEEGNSSSSLVLTSKESVVHGGVDVNVDRDNVVKDRDADGEKKDNNDDEDGDDDNDDKEEHNDNIEEDDESGEEFEEGIEYDDEDWEDEDDEEEVAVEEETIDDNSSQQHQLPVVKDDDIKNDVTESNDVSTMSDVLPSDDPVAYIEDMSTLTTHAAVPLTTPASPIRVFKTSGRGSRKFKIPKFSNSFTFASRFRNSNRIKQGKATLKNVGKHSDIEHNGSGEHIPKSYNRIPQQRTHFPTSTASPRLSSDKTRKIRIGERVYRRGQAHRALNSASTTFRGRTYFANEEMRKERERRVQERQSKLRERNRRMQKRLEEYNKRLREHRDKVERRLREREREKKRLNQVTGVDGGRSRLLDRRRKVKTTHLKAEVKVSPSSSRLSSSSYEKSIHIIKNRGPGGSSYIIKTGAEPDRRIPYNQSKTSALESKPTRRVVDFIPRVKPSSQPKSTTATSGRKVISRIGPREVTPNSVQQSGKIVPRVSTDDMTDTNTNIPRPSQTPRKIIPRVRGTEPPTESNNPEPDSIIVPNQHQATVDEEKHGSRDNSHVIQPDGGRPTFIPSERPKPFVSALNGDVISEGGANKLALPNQDVIPNRVDSDGHNPRIPGDNRLKTLGTDDVGDFSTNEWRISGLTECTHTCGGGVQQTIVVCVDTRTQAVVTDENCRSVRRPEVKAVKCNKRPCPAQWVPGPWSSCSVACGDGEQTRTVTCQARVSPTLNLTMRDQSCHHSDSPVERQHCSLRACSSWTVGNWSECSADCGDGVRTRTVQCVGPDNEPLNDDECQDLKPDMEETCHAGTCGKGWFFTDWPQDCPVSCGQGVITRKVFCASEDGQALPENRCDVKQRPETSKRCKVDTPCGGQWYVGQWSKCNTTCGDGFVSREVLCVKTLPGGVFAVVGEENCAGSPQPDRHDACAQPPCQPEWYTTSWGQCSQSCDTGYKTRELKCLSPVQLNSDRCPASSRPRTREPCNTQVCQRKVTPAVHSRLSGDGECKDLFSQCRVVRRARLCRYSYYNKVCCHSCSSSRSDSAVTGTTHQKLHTSRHKPH